MPNPAQNYYRRYIVLFLLLIICQHFRAQQLQWFTSDGSLSSSLINNVLYDSRGMIWVTTEDCLNRFDGSKFTIYRHDKNNPHSIANDHVNDVFEDAQGRLLVCTHAGVQIYDPATDSFSEPLKVKGSDSGSSPLSGIVQRSTGEMWAVGNDVYRVIDDKGALSLEHMDLPSDICFIYKGIADADDNIWLSKQTEGLYRINPKGEVKHYLGQPGDPIVTAFGIDKDKNLYAGTNKRGLYRFEKAHDTFLPVDLDNLADKVTISTIYPDDFGNILVGTDGGGLIMYDPKRASSFVFPVTNINYNKLKVHGLAKDAYGNLWIGVYQKGLLKLPKRPDFFKSIDQRNTNIIGSCCITSILRDRDGILWVGTDNDQIFAVDPETYTSRHYNTDVPNTVMGMFLDSSDRLWVGSYNSGMGRLDRHTGRFTPVKLDNNGIEASHIFDFAEMPGGDLLVATMGGGLFRLDPVTLQSQHLDLENLGNWITTVKVSETTGDVLVGSYNGFFVYDTDFKLKKWLLPTYIISSIHQEPEYGDIWLGSHQGLIRVNSDYEAAKVYTMEDGLPSRSISSIEHGDDALWIGTNAGLSKFDVKEGRFTNFTVDNGLPNNEFYRNSSYRDAEGNLFFGGINGIAAFKTDAGSYDGQKLTLRVTDFFIGDQSINASTLSGGHKIIDCPVADAEIFNLGAHDNSFAIRINTKEFVNTAQSDFYYSFDDGDWISIANDDDRSSGVTLTFTNVASGLHSLKVKAINAGIETDPLEISIDIDTVWYASWWAKIIYLLIAAALAYMIYVHVKKRMLLRQEAEERRHKAEILESKLHFFTNISHEIRTPLSLVISPLQKLKDKEKDPALADTYSLILRNANRILRLVNELMDLRKIDNKQMKMRFSHVDLCSFIGDLYETFRHAAAAKNINFVFTHPEGEDMEAWVDVSNFDKVVMNLLSNAIKFTPDNGKVEIALSKGSDITADGPLQHFIELSVTDTGIGVSADDQKHIFNRFFQGSNNKAGGTGIGLHLTRELVNLHYGTISIADNPDGEGTRFTVRIPSGGEHLSPEEIAQAAETKQEKKEIIEPAIDTPADNVADQSAEKPKTKPVRSNDVVYVVEDDEEIRQYLISNLEKYFHVYGFTNGKLALDAMHERTPSLVITDVMMPEMDGYTLTKKIKQNIRLNQTPVIILTAKTREEDNIDALESGATVYIPKPFNIDVVLKTAQHLIDEVTRLRNAFSGQQSQEDKLEDIDVMSNDEKLMERVMKVINKNISNSDITVEMIAQDIGISRVHLHRKLKELTNQSTRDFIRNIRLQAAAKLLREKKLTVSEVSDLVGFKQANNFSTVFKEMFGMSPTAYSAKYHQH